MASIFILGYEFIALDFLCFFKALLFGPLIV